MIFNMVGGAGGGKDGAATLTVTAPTNTNITVSKDTKSYTKNSGSTGVAVFQGLTTGTWAVSISNEQQTQTRTINITTTYSIVIAFFAATINITYPAGSTCTVTKGGTVFTAPDTSGTWDCVVPSTGTWVVACTNGVLSSSQNVSITADGQTESVMLSYFSATINVTYRQGATCTVSDGALTFDAPDTSGEWACIVPYAATWTVTSSWDKYGIDSEAQQVSITADGQTVDATLVYKLYLYSPGDQHTSITGGWALKSEFGHTPTFTNSYMEIVAAGDNTNFYGCVTFDPTILADFSTVKLNLLAVTSVQPNTQINMIITDSNTVATGAFPQVPSKTSTNITGIGSYELGVKSMDISSVTTGYFMIYNYNWTFKIDNIWLET